MKKILNKKFRPKARNCPVSEKKMKPQPVFDYAEINGSGKMKGKLLNYRR
jgi:hypothetical protein